MTRRRPPPLAHLRVLDLTDLRGAIAGRILAELGADVLMLEPPGGAPGRMQAPFAGGTPSPDRSLAFLFRSAGKRSATIDLESTAGRGRLAELLDDADVLLENLASAERRRLGLEPDELRRRHPHLVHVAIADFGLTGPRARWRLEPLPAFAACGALHGSGLRELPPCWIPGFLAHDCAATVGVAGALAALLAREPGAHGRTIEVSVQEAGLAGLTPWSIPVADYARVYPLVPVAPPRDGDGPYFVLPTAGGWVRVVAITPRQIAGLLRLLWPWSRSPAERTRPPAGRAGRGTAPATEAPYGGAGGASGSALPARALARLANGLADGLADGLAELPRRAVGIATSAVVMASRLAPLPGATLAATRSTLAAARVVAGAALRRRRRDAAVAAGLRLRVPIAPVLTPDEYAASEQARARQAFLATRFPHLRGAPLAPVPFRMTGSPPRLARGAPALAASVPAERAGFAERAPASSPAATAAGDARRLARRRPARGATLPLSGVRVVELSVGAAVPEIGWLLAELGADVIKVESTANVDFLRRVTIEPDTPNRSWTFNDSNRGKRSACIDLRTPRGRELALDLCATADVVLENSRGGVAEALGVAYADVRRRRPDVVYLSSQGYGRGGPLGEAPSYGPLVSAMSGVTWLQNHPGAPYPAGSSLNHPDHAASKLGLVAVLAALEHRRRTGEGQHVEMAQTDVAAFLAGPAYLEKACTGRPAGPRGNASDAAVPHDVYPCAGDDRWCAIAVASDDDWQRLRRHLGWSDEPRLQTLAGRLTAREEIDARLAAWTRTQDAEAAAAALQRGGVSAAAVAGATDLRADRHLAARRAFATVADPEIGPVLHCASPIRFADADATRPSRAARARAAPALGEHTEEVLVELLGLSPAAVRVLVASGVCR